jgi:hypothetical protein
LFLWHHRCVTHLYRISFWAVLFLIQKTFRNESSDCFICWNIFFFLSFSQGKATKSIYDSLDTISIYYPPLTFDTLSDGLNGYYVNGQRVDKKTSDAYQVAAGMLDKCRPCVLKISNETGIVSEGVQSGDGRIGYWIEYFSTSKKVKVSGHYKESPTADCTQYCSIMDGKWIYYNEKEKITRIEIYKNDKLISVQKKR